MFDRPEMFWDEETKRIKFVERHPTQTASILESLREKYRIHVIRVTQTPYNNVIHIEFDINHDELDRMAFELDQNLLHPLPPYPFTPLVYQGEGKVTRVPDTDPRPYIKCSEEKKEQFINMIERYCDTCFLGECDVVDEGDCRKCLERRVRWETD